MDDIFIIGFKIISLVFFSGLVVLYLYSGWKLIK